MLLGRINLLVGGFSIGKSTNLSYHHFLAFISALSGEVVIQLLDYLTELLDCQFLHLIDGGQGWFLR